MIPKILHYYWSSGKPTNFHQHCLDSWRRSNPEYTIHCFNKEDLKTLSQFNSSVLNSCRNFSEESDVARFWILYDHGGIYLDTDIELFRSIDFIFQNHDFSIGCSKDHCLQSGVIASIPKGKEIQLLCKNLPRRLKTHPNASSEYKFGPHYCMDNLNFTEVNKVYDFFPFSYSERLCYNKDNILDHFPNLVGVHYFDHSWSDKSIDYYMITDRSNDLSESNYLFSNKKFNNTLKSFDAIMTQKSQSEEALSRNLSENLPENWINFDDSWIRNKYILGCSASYVSLFYQIYTQKIPSADWYLVMEDDVTLNVEFSFLASQLNTITAELPDDIDLVNLCPLNSIISHKQFDLKHHIFANFYRKRNRAAFGSQVILYKHSFIEKMMKSLPLRNEIDIHYMLEMNDGKFKYWAHKNNWFNHFGEDHLDSVRQLYADKFNEHFPDEICIRNSRELPSRRSSQLDQ